MHWPNGETLFGHPDIVKHFRKIFVAAVANEGDDPFWFSMLAAISKGTCQQRPGGSTTENPFLTQKLTRGGEAVAVVNLKRLGHERHVGIVGNKIFPDSFHRPTARLDQLARFHPLIKNRAGRVGQNHFHSAARLDPVKKPSKSRQGSARTNSNYDRIDVVPHLLPNFGPSRTFMRQWIRRIAELIDVKSAWNFA